MQLIVFDISKKNNILYFASYINNLLTDNYLICLYRR